MTYASISNLAGLGNDPIEIVATAAADLVFGTGYNSVSAATVASVSNTKVDQPSPSANNSQHYPSGQNSGGKTQISSVVFLMQ